MVVVALLYALQIPGWSIVAPGTWEVSSMNLSVNASAPSAGMKKIPGLVQNCPTPRVSDPDAAAANDSASVSLLSTLGNTAIGLVALISAKTGIGSGLEAAMSIRALPPANEPVKPTAFISDAATTVCPTA